MDDQKCVFTWNNCHATSNDFDSSQTLAGVAFSPAGGEKLAVARKNSVKVYNRSPAWIEVCDLKPKSIQLSSDDTANVSVIAFSDDGRYDH